MYSTSNVVELMRVANPKAGFNENRIRSAIRYGKIAPPQGLFAGRFFWSRAEVRGLAKALGLVAPDFKAGDDA